MPSHLADVGGMEVRRALPHRARRTIGAWCFVDHFGPVGTALAAAMQVGPHPHIGLQTVTWLLEGEVLHTDSIGSEQLIRPGQLNLMTAGHGVAHAESAQAGASGSHGVQLWVALPDGVRDGPPAFEHHAALPEVELHGAVASVLVGALAGTASPATVHSPIVGAQVELRGGATVMPIDRRWEHGIVVLDGRVEVDGAALEPGALAYVAPGRDDLSLRADAAARLLLIGGEPFGVAPLIWWNFVARTRDEVAAARDDWEAGAHRFGSVATHLERIPAPEVPVGLKAR
jgi:redox-sensitive bicupin YhaK (pirin superfamily)